MLRQAVKSGRLATGSLAHPSSYLWTVLQGMWVGERTQGVIFGNRAQIIPGRPPSSTVVKRESWEKWGLRKSIIESSKELGNRGIVCKRSLRWSSDDCFYMIPAQALKVCFTYLTLPEWVSTLFFSASWICLSVFFTTLHLELKIRPSGNSGRSMDFGIRQIYLNLNLFDFGPVIFIPLNLGLCVHHRVVTRIERKKNIYN